MLDHRILLEQAIEKRAPLFADLSHTNAYRLIHSDADHLAGITVDNLAETILVEIHRQGIDIAPVLQALVDRFGGDTPIFLKARWSSNTGDCIGGQVRGLPCSPEITVRELGLHYALNLCDGEHIGLFLDARSVRKTVRELAPGRRVLNLFSYTSAFGVAAASGGARSTTNIDNKKSALERARQNYVLNDLTANTRTFLRSDVFQYLGRAVKGKACYDLIVLDPPPHSKRAGGRWFHARTGYPSLAARCLKLLAPGGILMAGLNDKKADCALFTNMLVEAGRIANKKTVLHPPIEPDVDFPPSKDRPVGQFRIVQAS